MILNKLNSLLFVTIPFFRLAAIFFVFSGVGYKDYPSESGLVLEGTVLKTNNNASFQKKDYLNDIKSKYTDVNELNNALQRTAGSLLNDIYFPFDESVYNPYMTSTPYVDADAITRRTS